MSAAATPESTLCLPAEDAFSLGGIGHTLTQQIGSLVIHVGSECRLAVMQLGSTGRGIGDQQVGDDLTAMIAGIALRVTAA